MQIIRPLELSFEQLKAMLRMMPPQEVRQKIWRSWKEEKKALEEQRYDSTTRHTSRNSVHFVYVHENGIKRVATYREPLAKDVRVP
jgi:hypothetical protein